MNINIKDVEALEQAVEELRQEYPPRYIKRLEKAIKHVREVVENEERKANAERNLFGIHEDVAH